MTTGTRAAALVAMIRNLDGDFTAQCQIAEDALAKERERCADLLEALRAILLQHDAGLAKLPNIIADEARVAVAKATECHQH